MNLSARVVTGYLKSRIEPLPTASLRETINLSSTKNWNRKSCSEPRTLTCGRSTRNRALITSTPPMKNYEALFFIVFGFSNLSGKHFFYFIFCRGVSCFIVILASLVRVRSPYFHVQKIFELTILASFSNYMARNRNQRHL